MNKEFVPYDLALALKELGFDEPCIGFYTQNAYGSTLEQKVQYWREPIGGNDDYVFVLAPLYQQAFRWFREKYGLWVRFSYDENELEEMYWYVDKAFESGIGPLFFDDLEEFNTYEEAELECLKKLIEIAKEQK